jgi:hypothetical protein
MLIRSLRPSVKRLRRPMASACLGFFSYINQIVSQYGSIKRASTSHQTIAFSDDDQKMTEFTGVNTADVFTVSSRPLQGETERSPLLNSLVQPFHSTYSKLFVSGLFSPPTNRNNPTVANVMEGVRRGERQRPVTIAVIWPFGTRSSSPVPMVTERTRHAWTVSLETRPRCPSVASCVKTSISAACDSNMLLSDEKHWDDGFICQRPLAE